MDLEDLKKTIESLSKEQHIEVLKIIYEFAPATINENKSGIYINMAFLTKDTVDKLKQYIEYIQDQEQMLKPFECQKEDFKNTFFIEKELKDSMLYSFRN
jgi:hypothetical protein